MEFSKISSALISLIDSTKDYLKAHNVVRAVVGVGPLKWDNQVARFAQHYAKKRIHDCDLVHSYGENLAMSYGEMFGRDVVSMWVGEKLNYDYDPNSCSPGKSCHSCGHYTQLVWRNSTHLECTKVRCNNGGTFIGCNYNPSGNWVGETPY